MTIANAAKALGLSKARIFQLIKELGLHPRLKTVRVQVFDLSRTDMDMLRERNTRRGPKGNR